MVPVVLQRNSREMEVTNTADFQVVSKERNIVDDLDDHEPHDGAVVVSVGTPCAHLNAGSLKRQTN